MTHHKNTQKGFTLIELLVVVSIIGLLSTIVLGSLASARTKAEQARTKTELGQIRIVLEQYYSDYGGYPWPGSDEFYCLGVTCAVAGIPGTTILTEYATIIEHETRPTGLAAVAIPIPKFSTGKEIDGYLNYAYFPCENPIDSPVALSTKVCPGNSSDTNIEVVSNLGYIGSGNNFKLETFTYVGGSDSGSGSGGGSDSGSSSYSDSGSSCSVGDPYDYDCDLIPDGGDNCSYVWNPGQEDMNGFEDYTGNGDVCEDPGSGSSSYSDSGSDSYSSY
jgi:prepilin-type N-terminal cleavage/methylation domain-containing protein